MLFEWPIAGGVGVVLLELLVDHCSKFETTRTWGFINVQPSRYFQDEGSVGPFWSEATSLLNCHFT